MSKCLFWLFSCQCLAVCNAQECLAQGGSPTKYIDAVAATKVMKSERYCSILTPRAQISNLIMRPSPSWPCEALSVGKQSLDSALALPIGNGPMLIHCQCGSCLSPNLWVEGEEEASKQYSQCNRKPAEIYEGVSHSQIPSILNLFCDAHKGYRSCHPLSAPL